MKSLRARSRKEAIVKTTGPARKSVIRSTSKMAVQHSNNANAVCYNAFEDAV